MSDVQYRVSLNKVQAHRIDVELRIERPDPEGQILSLPAWIPGSYMIRDFAKHILGFAAVSPAGPLAWEKQDKQTWRCAPYDGPLLVRYQVYAWDLSVRSAHADTTHAYFNGTSVFLRVDGQTDASLGVVLVRPDPAFTRDWSVATSLRAKALDSQGFGRYRADDYADLIDHPVEIGALDTLEFAVEGIPHRMAIYGRQHADKERLSRDLERICHQHARMFGELPLDRYLFLVMAVGDGYGGLEHRYSTSLLCNRDDLPAPGEDKPGEGYRRFLGLCSHEYFHLWNVKRITPAVFQIDSLDREIHTNLLWVFEGITSYYDDLALVRSGCIEPKHYLELLANTITRVMGGSGRFKQSVAESSFDAWTRFYKQDENAPNAIVSYYTKGALVALALDLILRRDSDERTDLDQVMREFWLRHGRTGVGVRDGDLEALVAELSGLELDGFFARAVHGREDLPLAELLDLVGVEMRLRPARDAKDLGGCVEKFTDAGARKRVLGIRLRDGRDAVIANVFEGGAAEQAGLSAGDQVLAVDSIKADAASLGRLIERAPGPEVEIHLFRRDELLRFMVRPAPAPRDTCELRLGGDDQAEARRARWLGQTD